MDNEALSFLAGKDTAVLASVLPGGLPRIATVHIAVDANNSFIFKSRANSDHIANLGHSNESALAIYDHASSFHKKAGLQFTGAVQSISDLDDMRNSVELYSATFPGAADGFDPLDVLVRPDAPSTLFRFIPTQYKFVNNWSGRFDREYRAW